MSNEREQHEQTPASQSNESEFRATVQSLSNRKKRKSKRQRSDHTGRWTDAEHRRFLEGIKMYGKHWRFIRDRVRTRTIVQVRTHAQKYFQRLEKETKDAKPSKSRRKSSMVLLLKAIENNEKETNNKPTITFDPTGGAIEHLKKAPVHPALKESLIKLISRLFQQNSDELIRKLDQKATVGDVINMLSPVATDTLSYKEEIEKLARRYVDTPLKRLLEPISIIAEDKQPMQLPHLSDILAKEDVRYDC